MQEATQIGPRRFKEFTANTRKMASTFVDEDNIACRLSKPLPKGTIDSHMHIIPPDFDKFPILSSAQYKPTPHTLSDAYNFYRLTSGLGIATPRLVLTQVSIYGKDNSALLSGVADLAENGRGVVEMDPASVSVSQLQAWWKEGVRGVRINLVSVGKSMTEDELHNSLQRYVDKLIQHDLKDKTKRWVIEMYLPLKSVPAFLKVLPKIENSDRVRWCLDHFGGLKFSTDAPNFGPDDDPHLIHGFSELVQVLTDPALAEVYLKLSAAYRMDADYPNAEAIRRLDPIGSELVRKAPDRVIWASDWPHTRFENVDSIPFVEACYRWCGEGADGVAKREKLFRLNSEKLWDMA